jgi:hypothetical protein
VKVDIVTPFYGERYTSLFFETLLPSLAPNIIEMIMYGAEVVHYVHCPELESVCVEGYRSVAEWPVIISTEGFTGNPDIDRGAAIHPCYQQSIKRGNLTVVAPADHLFGRGLWGVIKDLKQGEYLVCGHMRIAHPSALRRAKEYLAEPQDASNRRLVRVCIDELKHLMVDYGMGHPDPYWRCTREGERYQVFFCTPPPLAFVGTEDMLLAWSQRTLFGPLEVIDHDLPNHCFKNGTLKWIDDSRKFFWAEWTPDDRYLHSNGSQIQTIYALDSLKHFNNIPLYWYR